MGRTKIIDKSICFNCGSTTTYIDKKNNEHWNYHDGKKYCEKCNNKLFKNPKWKPITTPLKLYFKTKQVYVKEKPRKGICSWCKRIDGEPFINAHGKPSIIKTSIHHVEYHQEDVLKDTIELCQSCHMKESWNNGAKLGRPLGN